MNLGEPGEPVRQAAVPISEAVLMKLLRGKIWPAKSSIPDDVRLVRAFVDDHQPGIVWLVLESESFQLVAWGDRIPTIEVKLESLVQ